MTGQDGLEQVAIHAIVIDDKDFDHSQSSRTGMHGASRLIIGRIA